MPFGKDVNAVIEQHDVDVDVTPHGMYKVVSADSKSVAVTTNLPYREVRVNHLQARCHGSRTPMYGLHGVSIHIIRQSARASYT